MTVESLLRALGAPVPSTEEETFELFARDLPSHNLGFIDAKAATLELTVSGRDLTIHQSPGVLSSNRAGGTTGAVIWKITPLFAEWLSSSSSNSNPLFAHGVLNPSSHVVELGCGISALVALLLAPRVARYVLTDQPYVARLVEQNVAENWRAVSSSSASASSTTVGGKKSRSKARGTVTPHPASPPLQPVSGITTTTAPRKARGAPPARDRDRDGPGAGKPGLWESKIRFAPLDWETDVVTAALAASPSSSSSDSNAPETIRNRSFDAVVACDCVYNEALIEPFVSTCADLCRLRATTAAEGQEGGEPCVCVIAQQLRDPLVFEAWLECFARSFHTWRVPDAMLNEGLRSGSGFVVHVGVLRDCGIVADEDMQAM